MDLKSVSIGFDKIRSNTPTIFVRSEERRNQFSWDETLSMADDPHFAVDSATMPQVTNGFGEN